MSDKHDNPLRLDPPVRRSDPALGERLALLARASTPTPVRHRAWRAPLAGLAIVVGTGGLAYGTQAVVEHRHGPSLVVPGADLSLTPGPSSASDGDDDGSSLASSPAAPDRSEAPVTSGDQTGHAGGGRSADALASAPGQVIRSAGPGAVEHPSQSRGDEHGRPSSPGDPSTSAPGRGLHSKGSKPTTAASPTHPARPSGRPTVHPTARPSLPPTAQVVE